MKDVMGGLGLPAATIVSPWHMGFAEARISAMPFDPARAAALLDTAGGPREITLRAPLYMPERAPDIAAFLAHSLSDIGFQVTVETATDRPGYARELGEKHTGDLAIFDSSPHSSFRVLDDKISSRSRAIWWQGVEDALADALWLGVRHGGQIRKVRVISVPALVLLKIIAMTADKKTPGILRSFWRTTSILAIDLD